MKLQVITARVNLNNSHRTQMRTEHWHGPEDNFPATVAGYNDLLLFIFPHCLLRKTAAEHLQQCGNSRLMKKAFNGLWDVLSPCYMDCDCSAAEVPSCPSPFTVSTVLLFPAPLLTMTTIPRYLLANDSSHPLVPSSPLRAGPLSALCPISHKHLVCFLPYYARNTTPEISLKAIFQSWLKSLLKNPFHCNVQGKMSIDKER